MAESSFSGIIPAPGVIGATRHMHTQTPLPLRGSPADFLKKAVTVARGSGFRHFDEVRPLIRNAGDEKRAPVPAIDAKSRKIDSVGGEFAHALKGCADKGLLPSREPILMYHASITPGSPGKISFGLHILGSKNSIAEALILKTAFGIIEETGIKGTTLFVNSIGDRDSSAKFARESGNFLKRHAERLPSPALEILKDDVFLALEMLAKKRHPVYEEIPRPYEFLTSASRRHLREVLEFIERNEIPYEIDDLLIGHRDCYAQTLFEIRGPEGEDGSRMSVARGGRYDEFPRRLFKLSSPGVGIVFTVTGNGAAPAPEKVVAPKSSREPKICFIHVGFEAKVKSLMVIDAMRRARVPFYQCLQFEKLTDQMRYAESLSVPYTLIMGHKEALEGCVIVRNVSTRAQEAVPIASLSTFFRSKMTW